jgi:L-lactate dehydrogenase
MKIGIVGTGHVGCACAMAVVIRGSAREIVLVNRERKTAEAVATDIRYGVPLGRKVDIVDGDYEALKGAGIVLITVGVNEKTGGATDRNDPQGRLRLLDANAKIYREIVPKIVAAAPEAVLLVVSDPPDPLADVARDTCPHAAVLSTGTYLDSQRFRVHLGKHFGVDAAHVEAQVIGDHGTAQVFLWSSARIGGVALAHLLKQRGENLSDLRQSIEKDVRYANITIIEGNDASQYGIGIVSARIAEICSATSAPWCRLEASRKNSASHYRCRAWSDARALSACSNPNCPMRNIAACKRAPRLCRRPSTACASSSATADVCSC